MKKLFVSGFMAFVALLTGASIVLACFVSSVQRANCSGYEVSAEYSGNKDDKRKVVWDVDIKINGVDHNQSGSWEGKSNGFEIFKKTGGKADVSASGYVKLYKLSHGTWGSWVEEDHDNFNLDYHKSGCPTPTPTPTVAPTATPTSTPVSTPTPTSAPTVVPTATPTVVPTIVPTATPVNTSTPAPTVEPSPTGSPSNTSVQNSNNGSSSAPECTNQKLVYPMNVSAISSGNSVRLTWTKVPGATGYSIMYGPSANNLIWGVPDTGNTDTFLINGLSTGYFSIRSLNGCMPGDPSVVVSTGGRVGSSQVLGASTMAGTGSFNAMSFYKALIIAGISSAILGLALLARNGSFNKVS